ncbi:MmgE/PrpD family protein [Mameliella alba]|nr:MmgE/PrpD family protein [Antarctobacter heliothermus]MBY6144014.1 MmgE/PrpD family protein [Mameliella alba]MCA0954062.1 MmgE/PrpD family protein [Mameliella alba]
MNVETRAGVTRQIAEFVTRTGFDDLPAEAVEAARRCILDGIAVMIAGSDEPCARIAREYVASVDGRGVATTLGAGSLSAPVHLAALANGIAGHALDYDDTALSLEKDRSVLIHPTMPPLCAALAIGQDRRVSGKDFLAAFVLGFEVEVKIAEAIHPDHFAGGRGFHSSGTIGVFGSVVAACKLMQLTQEQTRNALAIAATMSAGLGVNHGTMSKPLNMGRSSETGVTAAQLASLGFDGPVNALEGGRGFFEAFGGGFVADRIQGRLGAPFAILEPGTSVKPYPSGVVGHPGMDAMGKLVSDHDLSPDDVAQVRVRTGPNVIHPGPLRIAHATTALEGKFCVPFQMAAMILRRKAGLAEFSDEFVASAPCQDMQKRVDAMIDPEIAALGKDKIVFDIEVETRDGRRFTQRSAEHYRGGPLNPLSWHELCGKFRDCADAVLSPAKQDRIIALADGLEDLADLSELIAAAKP